MPKRIRLSRAKGWRMPPNTVKVDRSTRWGNPFVVGKHGTLAECLDLYGYLLGGALCLTTGNADEQRAANQVLGREMKAGWPNLRGKDLACWCALDKPCHADMLLTLANAPPSTGPGESNG